MNPNRKRQTGSTLVIVAIFMVALFGFAALSVDVGNVYVQRNKIQEGVDAAALAAVVDWADGATPTEVDVMARAYALTNGVRNAEVLSVRAGIWQAGAFTEVNPIPASSVPAVEVVARRTVDLTFARVVGMQQMQPRVVGVAVIGRAYAGLQALPWAVCDTFVPNRCQSITLQFKSGGETNACSDSGPLSGNFGQLTLPGGNGASWYKSNIENGYPGVLRVGQCVDTDPGVSWGPTKQGIDDRLQGLPPYTCTATSDPPDNKRLAVLPKVLNLDVSGKKQVCITGFYVVVLDDYSNSDKTVTARFLDSYAGSEVDPNAPPVPGELSGVTLVQ